MSSYRYLTSVFSAWLDGQLLSLFFKNSLFLCSIRRGRKIVLALCPQLCLQGHPSAVRTLSEDTVSDIIHWKNHLVTMHLTLAAELLGVGANGQNWRVSGCDILTADEGPEGA